MFDLRLVWNMIPTSFITLPASAEQAPWLGSICTDCHRDQEGIGVVRRPCLINQHAYLGQQLTTEQSMVIGVPPLSANFG